MKSLVHAGGSIVKAGQASSSALRARDLPSTLPPSARACFSLALLDKCRYFPDRLPSSAPPGSRAAPQRHPLMQERWLSVEEIAAHLDVNRDTIYKWLTRKKMPAHKVGRLWKFLASEIDQWVKGGQAAQVKPGPKKP